MDPYDEKTKQDDEFGNTGSPIGSNDENSDDLDTDLDGDEYDTSNQGSSGDSS